MKIYGVLKGLFEIWAMRRKWSPFVLFGGECKGLIWVLSESEGLYWCGVCSSEWAQPVLIEFIEL